MVIGFREYFCIFAAKRKIMDLLHIIAVIALVVIGVLIFRSKNNG